MRRTRAGAAHAGAAVKADLRSLKTKEHDAEIQPPAARGKTREMPKIEGHQRMGVADVWALENRGSCLETLQIAGVPVAHGAHFRALIWGFRRFRFARSFGSEVALDRSSSRTA